MAPRTARFCGERPPDFGPDTWATSHIKDSACAAFFPHFHPERLEKLAHWRKPRRIFMDSMGDWWDPNVKQEWRDECYRAMAQRPDNRYLVLTKQPQNVTAGDVHPYSGVPGSGGLHLWYVWLGVTIEAPDFEWRQDRAPSRFVSAEPLFDAFYLDPECGTEWLILGADSRRNPYLPGEQAFRDMIAQADDLGVPVFLKDNALKHYPGLPVRREFPEGLRLPGEVAQ